MDLLKDVAQGASHIKSSWCRAVHPGLPHAHMGGALWAYDGQQIVAMRHAGPFTLELVHSSRCGVGSAQSQSTHSWLAQSQTARTVYTKPNIKMMLSISATLPNNCGLCCVQGARSRSALTPGEHSHQGAHAVRAASSRGHRSASPHPGARANVSPAAAALPRACFASRVQLCSREQQQA